MENGCCMRKNTFVFGGKVEKKNIRCYFYRAKHNSVNACMRVSANIKWEEG